MLTEYNFDIRQIKDIKQSFILSSARTGSTLLSSMLNTHPNILSTREEPFAYNLYPKYKRVKKWTSKTIQDFCYDFYLFSEGELEVQFGTKKDLEAVLEKHKLHLTVEIAIKLAYLCFFPTKDKSEIYSIVDKQIKFHFCLDKVADFYPHSKFIILHRDPRDTALAKWKMRQKINKELTYFRIALEWKFIYKRLLFLKNKIGNDRFIEIKYEDLVSNPEVELKKICAFLNISYNPVMMKYDEQIKNYLNLYKDKFSIGTKDIISLLHDGITKKVNTDKVGFWKKELKREEVDLIWSICGELAEKIGYESDLNYTKQGMKYENYIDYMKKLMLNINSIVYHASPFHLKYIIKKIKYGKKFNDDNYSNGEYYKKFS